MCSGHTIGEYVWTCPVLHTRGHDLFTQGIKEVSLGFLCVPMCSIKALAEREKAPERGLSLVGSLNLVRSLKLIGELLNESLNVLDTTDHL